MLKLTPEEAVFQEDVRTFFARDYPAHVIAKNKAGQRLTKQDHIDAQRALNARGWLGVGWPSDVGGTGWTPTERYIFDQELEFAHAAGIIPMAVIYIGPIIAAFGSEQQKAEWLPAILESRCFWAQGYSEPEAGSDLASLRFSAVRDGGDYILNGTKIWTSGAHWADWIFCLARTSREERKQQGISLICSPLDLPGVRVHPIRLIDGSDELARIEFDNVRVPVTNRIGDEGQAWHYANVLLKTERLSYAHIGSKKRDLAHLLHEAAQLPASGGGTMDRDPAFRFAHARVEARLAAIEASILRALRGEVSMATAAALKIACTECAQAITELGIDLAGRNRLPMLDRSSADWADAAPATAPFGPAAVQSYLFERAQTIYGGSTEVQKNIIWRARGDGAMSTPLSDAEQAMLRDAVRAYLAKGDAHRWPDFADRLGIGAALLDAQQGAIIAEEIGRARAHLPVADVATAAWLLDRCSAPALPAAAIATLAWAELSLRYDFSDIETRARSDGDGWRLDGTKAVVGWAAEADAILVAARAGDEGLSLFRIDPAGTKGLRLSPYQTIDGHPAADLIFDDHALPADALIGPEGGALDLLEEARDRACALLAAEAVGLLDGLLEQTVAYTGQRGQFGQPIASFQALQHRMVDMYLECELARSSAWLAVEALSEASATRTRAVSSAMVNIARACRLVGQEAIQLHGGMGMTDELPIGHYVKRAMAIEVLWADTDWHLARIAGL